MDQPEENEAPASEPLPIEPGHVMSWERYEQMLEEQQK